MPVRIAATMSASAGASGAQALRPEAYDVQPSVVHRFYDDRRRALGRVAPNPAHLALARLEEGIGDDLLVITQNIDDLHERAGSTRVVHMHGGLAGPRSAAPACGVRRGRVTWATSRPARGAVSPSSGPTSCGSARCPTRWTGSSSPSTRPTCSSRSAPRVRSTLPRVSCSSRRAPAPAPGPRARHQVVVVHEDQQVGQVELGRSPSQREVVVDQVAAAADLRPDRQMHDDQPDRCRAHRVAGVPPGEPSLAPVRGRRRRRRRGSGPIRHGTKPATSGYQRVARCRSRRVLSAGRYAVARA